MPLTAKPSAKTTPNATSGLTMLRKDVNTGATALCTLIAEGPPPRNATLQEHTNVHHNHRTWGYLNPWSMVLMALQDQVAQNATVCLVATPLILMNVTMAPLPVLRISSQGISVMMEIFKKWKEFPAPQTARLFVRIMMSASFSPIGLKRRGRTDSAIFIEVAMNLQMKSAGSGSNVIVDQPTQTWTIAAHLNFK